MQLNIKNAETITLAQALAKQTQQSITAVITDALRAKQALLDQQKKPKIDIAYWLKVGQENRDKMGEAAAQHMINHADWLYDDNGLPQ